MHIVEPREALCGAAIEISVSVAIESYELFPTIYNPAVFSVIETKMTFAALRSEVNSLHFPKAETFKFSIPAEPAFHTTLESGLLVMPGILERFRAYKDWCFSSCCYSNGGEPSNHSSSVESRYDGDLPPEQRDSATQPRSSGQPISDQPVPFDGPPEYDPRTAPSYNRESSHQRSSPSQLAPVH